MYKVGYETEYVSRENDNNNKFHVVAKEDTSEKSLELVSDQLLIVQEEFQIQTLLTLKKAE